MKARLVITTQCNRNCANCCNKEGVFDQARPLEDLHKLLEYEEVMITGGEPALVPQKVEHIIDFLQGNAYKGKIYLYSAYFNDPDWFGSILPCIHGFHFTLHNEAGDLEVRQLKRLSECGILDYSTASNRLAIDSRLYEKYDFSNIDFSRWDVVRKLKWIVDCPLPDKEELLILGGLI